MHFTVRQSRLHQFGESSKLGIIDRREVFPADLGVLQRGKTKRPLGLQSFDAVVDVPVRRVPFQYNFDDNIGPANEGRKNYLNFQPVIPISLNADWNLISRTIVPIVDQENIFPGAGDQFGLSDTTQSFFFSPKQPTNGIIWGVGPALLLPTGTDDLLTADKWGAGPTAVALTQQSGWTVGMLANHLWSFAGDEDRPDVNQTFLQPFVSYITPQATTFTLNTETTYNWTTEEWSVPINFLVSQLIKVGDQPISIGAGVRYWADAPDSGPEGWGGRAFMTFLFPTGN